MSLVDVAQLAARLDEPELRVVDVRWYLDRPEAGRTAYLAGHIPGAVFCDLETDLSDHRLPGRHPLPSPGAFTRTLEHMGIHPDDFVVAYDDASGAVAARLWWMLRSIGHRRVAVLDGGYPAWVRAGLPVQTGRVARERSSYPPAHSWRGTVETAEILERLGELVLVDARDAARFRGEHEPVDPVAGHIPGAVNLPYRDNLTPEGLFRSPEELRLRFLDVAGSDTVVYCGSGVTACHLILAMTVAGLQPPRLYAGSWSAWVSDPTRPIDVG